MSIPAVLYDHVPVDDPQYGSDTQGFFVSSMIHQSSAPREDDNGDNDDRQNKHIKQPQCISIVADSHGSNDGVSTNIDDKMYIESEIKLVENDDSDDSQMETIIEATDSDYVLIPIPPPMVAGDNDKILPVFSHTMTSIVSKKIRACGNAFLRATTRSSEQNKNRIVNLSKANDIIAKCVSGWTSRSRALVKPFQLYARDLLSSSIYNSFDCLSEAVIDDSGNRLLLPGPCVAFDSDNSPNGNCNRVSYDADTLIIPAESDSIRLNRGIVDTSSSPLTSSLSCSSIWTSKTVMVSAHDLLTVKYDQRMQKGDRNAPRHLPLLDIEGNEKNGKPSHSYSYHEYNEDRSTIIVTSSQTGTQQWIRAIWKLAQKKASLWYYMSQSNFKQSIKSAGRAFFYSQQFLIQHRKSGNRRRNRSLFTLSNNAFTNSNDDPCHIDYDANKRAEQESSRFIILCVPQQNLSKLFIDDSHWSDENINGCDEDGFVVEMTTSLSKSKDDYSW